MNEKDKMVQDELSKQELEATVGGLPSRGGIIPQITEICPRCEYELVYHSSIKMDSFNCPRCGYSSSSGPVPF